MANESSIKYLNLDEVAPPQKTVKIGGVEYKVMDMTVENFIESSRMVENKDATAEEQTLESVRTLKRYIPDIPESELMKLSFEKLTVLIHFVNGAYAEVTANAPDATAQPSPEGESKKE